MRRYLSLTLCLVTAIVVAQEENAEEGWLDGIDQEEVNGFDRELVFLEQGPDKPVHHHYHSILLGSSSIQDGWVRVNQCHYHLDPVAQSQIVFRTGRVRELRILSREGITSAWIESDSVQLEDVSKGASLCLQGELKLLTKVGEDAYLLRSGPFMRRFLDGYYPLRVVYELDYQDADLELVEFTPPAQAGFNVIQESQKFRFDSWFEGRLDINLIFKKRTEGK